MKTLRWEDTVLSDSYSPSLSARDTGFISPQLGIFINKPCSWSKLTWNCNHGAFYGIMVVWESESATLCLMFTIERNIVVKGISLILLAWILWEPSFIMRTPRLAANLMMKNRNSQQIPWTLKEENTLWLRQIFQCLFTFSRPKKEKKIAPFCYRYNSCSLQTF